MTAVLRNAILSDCGSVKIMSALCYSNELGRPPLLAPFPFGMLLDLIVLIVGRREAGGGWLNPCLLKWTATLRSSQSTKGKTSSVDRSAPTIMVV